jgi:hypothetical protein
MRNFAPQPGASSRKPIILIGAPSGAGKTVLSKQIIAGALPFFTDLCGGAPNETPLRYDIKTLPDDPARDRVLIIECSTHKFDQFIHTDQWRRMLDLVRKSEQVICVTLDVPQRTVVRQYFLRIFTGPKRMHVLQRVLQVSKYLNTLIYMLTGQISRANAAWEHFGDNLAIEVPSRVLLVRAERRGTKYSMTLNGRLDESSGELRSVAADTMNKSHPKEG